MSEHTELLSLVLILKPLSLPEDGLPNWMGRSAHGLLFNVIEQANPELAKTIHQTPELRPFTVSSLFKDGSSTSDPSLDVHYLRMTALREDIATILSQSTLPGAFLSTGQTIRLDQALFTIQDTALTAEQHPQADGSTYPVLAARFLTSMSSPSRRIDFHFLSPTFFQNNRQTIPFPLPGLVFGSLLEHWNLYSTIPLPAEVQQYAYEKLHVSRFDIHSRGAVVAGGVHTGMIGKVGYIVSEKDADRYLLTLLHLLARYAFYAGVGAKTSMGMGQCKTILDSED